MNEPITNCKNCGHELKFHFIDDGTPEPRLCHYILDDEEALCKCDNLEIVPDGSDSLDLDNQRN